MLSSRAKAGLAFLPFGYQVVTRIHGWRDLAYLVVTSWVPALWILARTGDLPFPLAVMGFALGFVAFISLYELGYLANDWWDAGRHSNGRQRLPFAGSPTHLLVFCLIRVGTWLAVAVGAGFMAAPFWLAASLALVAAMAIHNLLRSPSLRLASFAQMTVLRFVLPVAPILSSAGWVAALMAAVLLYLPLRYLSYADSKGLLTMSDRRSPRFAPAYLAAGLPLVTVIALVLNLKVLVEVALFLLIAHAAWALLVRQASGAKR